MLNKLKQWWENTKAFFAYSHSIFMARLTALVGFVVAVLGIIDWSPLIGLNVSTGLSKTQVIWMGAVVFIKGVADELARRMKGRTPTL